MIVFDELGGNTSQKHDGNVEGQLILCERGNTPQRKISTRGKHYTMMGVTSLTGEPVMCIIIFAGRRPNALLRQVLLYMRRLLAKLRILTSSKIARVQGKGSQEDLHANT